MNLSSPGWLFLTRDNDFLRVSVGALGGGCQDPGGLGANELPNGIFRPENIGRENSSPTCTSYKATAARCSPIDITQREASEPP